MDDEPQRLSGKKVEFTDQDECGCDFFCAPLDSCCPPVVPTHLHVTAINPLTGETLPSVVVPVDAVDVVGLAHGEQNAVDGLDEVYRDRLKRRN